MKTIKIGAKSYERFENLFCIGDERFLIFKQYMLQAFECIDKPSFMAMHNRVTKYFNGGDTYRIMVELENFKKSLELSTLNYDAFSICFALMHLDKENGEQMVDFDTEKQLGKLAEMRAEGLTREEVEETVENFMIALPKHFAHYLGMLEIMKEIRKGEISSALRG